MKSLEQNSRLLGLPTEILKRIVEFAIGGQVLHVILKRDAYHKGCRRYETCPNRRHGFYITLCAARISEQQAWEEFHSVLPHSVPRGDRAAFHEPRPLIRHQDCDSYMGVDCSEIPAVSSFSIFYVCNRLTKEAFHVFWATNTFSINSWPIFTEFLKSISKKSKHTIRAIDLDVNIHCEITGPFDPVEGFHDEEIDLVVPSDLECLSSLDSLNPSICSNMMTKLGFSRDLKLWRKPTLNLRACFVRDVLRLEALDIKQLNIIVYDDFEDYQCSDLWPYWRRTRKVKQELAKEVYAILTSDKRREMLGRDLRI